MNRPKLGILRKVYLTNRGHFRYYSPRYDRLKLGNIPKRLRPKMPILDLNDYQGILTEKQLLQVIFKNFGEGEYRLIAYVKGHRGAWTFWKGTLLRDGFIKDRRESSYKKKMDKLQEELLKADEDQRESLFEDIEAEKNLQQFDSSRYGFHGYIKASSKPGELFLWHEKESTVKLDNWEEKNLGKDEWGETVKEQVQFEEWK